MPPIIGDLITAALADYKATETALRAQAAQLRAAANAAIDSANEAAAQHDALLAAYQSTDPSLGDEEPQPEGDA
jgi:hypothetical protein